MLVVRKIFFIIFVTIWLLILKLILKPMKDKLEIKVAIQVLKPVSEVFESIADPAQMSNYFIAYSSGRIEGGKQLTWRFPEFDMDIPIRVGKVEKDKYISYYWDHEGKELFVEIVLEPYKNNNTIVKISEKSMENNQDGIKWFGGNTEGWAYFLSCLKAWAEYGINLRKGAFDFRFDK